MKQIIQTKQPSNTILLEQVVNTAMIAVQSPGGVFVGFVRFTADNTGVVAQLHPPNYVTMYSEPTFNRLFERMTNMGYALYVL